MLSEEKRLKRNAYMKEWGARNPDRRREYRIRAYNKNKEKILSQWREQRKRLKVYAIQAYGGQCICCGEGDIRFLTIDHINNDGAIQRKTLKYPKNVYQWLKKMGYPEGYQIMCFNCNCGRALNDGICPHKDGGV